MWRAPFSAIAAIVTASIGSHFAERGHTAHDGWTQLALFWAAGFMGIITVMETLQVWRQLGFAGEEQIVSHSTSCPLRHYH